MSFDDMVGEGSSSPEESSFNKLIYSILHQIRVISAQEHTSGMMFYALVGQGANYSGTSVPTRYQPSVPASFNHTVHYLYQILQPYGDERFSKVSKQLLKVIQKIEDEAQQHFLKFYDHDEEQRRLLVALKDDEPYDSILMRWKHLRFYRKAFPIYRTLFQECLSLLSRLGILPPSHTSADEYAEDRIL